MSLLTNDIDYIIDNLDRSLLLKVNKVDKIALPYFKYKNKIYIKTQDYLDFLQAKRTFKREKIKHKISPKVLMREFLNENYEKILNKTLITNKTHIF